MRTLVHEYGGGAFFVFNGAVYFSNFQDQVMYIQKSADSTPEAVTEVGRKWRYADGFYSVTVQDMDMFYLQLYGIRYMVKDHSDSERGNLLPPHGPIFPISSMGSFICIIPQTG